MHNSESLYEFLILSFFKLVVCGKIFCLHDGQYRKKISPDFRQDQGHSFESIEMATWEMSNIPQGTVVLSLVHGMLGVLNSI